MKARVFAPVNIALIKYWGKRDEKLRLAANSNLSVCLKSLGTKTSLKWVKGLESDEVIVDGEVVVADRRERVVKHLDRVRKLAGIDLRAKVVSRNSFAMGVGLSSSASGMAALTLSAVKAAGLEMSEKELSILARKASGSASRSIPDGWVMWQAGLTDKTSYAKSVFGEDCWDLRVLVVILSGKEKEVSSTKGQVVAKTSPYYNLRLKESEKNLRKIKKLIKAKDFLRMGELIEDEAMNLHAVMLTSSPNLIYWLPETVRVMRAVRDWREKGLNSFFTINTGQNVLVFCQPKDEKRLMKRLELVEGVIEVKRDRIGKGARLLA